MGMDVKLLVCFFVTWNLGSFAQHTDTPAETPFPECVRVEEKCRGPLRGCREGKDRMLEMTMFIMDILFPPPYSTSFVDCKTHHR